MHLFSIATYNTPIPLSLHFQASSMSGFSLCLVPPGSEGHVLHCLMGGQRIDVDSCSRGWEL